MKAKKRLGHLLRMRDERGGHVTVVGVVDGGANLSHRSVPVAPTAAARDAALRGPETNKIPFLFGP